MKKLLLNLIFILLFFLLPLTVAQAGILFSSSWNTTTGSSENAIEDGSEWEYTTGSSGVQQDPYVSSGGPGGNNFLNMVTPGGGGSGSPYYNNWFINEDVYGVAPLGDPDDIYVRFYFRIHEEWSDGGATHWFQAVNNRSDKSTSGFYLEIAEDAVGEFPELETDVQVYIEMYGSGRFAGNVSINREQWYRWEVHVTKIDASYERWYIRLDGVDITDEFLCISSSCTYGEWLGDRYDDGWSFANKYHGNVWITNYDQDSVNDGWDVACVEFRDDTWPGAIGGETTPPTLTGYDPADEETDVSASTNIYFEIDDNVQVDIDTLDFEIALDDAIINGVCQSGYDCTMTVDGNGYNVTINPDDDFDYDTEIGMAIFVQDTSGNSVSNNTWDFTTEAEPQSMATGFTLRGGTIQ